MNKALEINPKSALAYCNLGWTYEAIGDERKAIADYRKALEIDPSLEAARDNLTLLGMSTRLFTGQARSRNGSIAGIAPVPARWLARARTGGVELMNKRISSVCFDVPVFE